MAEAITNAPRQLSTEELRQMYGEYEARYSGQDRLRPLPYEQWLQEERLEELPQQQPDSPSAPAPAEQPAPAGLSNQSSTLEGVTVNYGDGNTNTVVVSPNISPVINNNIGAMPETPAAEPRRIEVVEPETEPEPVPVTPEPAPAAPEPAPPEPEPTPEPAPQPNPEQQQTNQRLEALEQQMQQLTQQLQELMQQLQNPNNPPAEPEPTPEPTPNPTPEELLAEARGALTEARDDLIRVTIRRRARAGDGLTAHRREDKEAYEAAMANYKEHLANFLRIRAQIHEANGLQGNRLRRQLDLDRYAEQRAFARREVTVNEQIYQRAQREGGWRAWRDRIIRFWGNRSTGGKLLIGAGVGAGVAIAAGTMGASIALLAAGSAAKFSLGLLNRGASARNVSERSRDQELGRITRESRNSLLHLSGPADMDEFLEALTGAQEGYLNERVKHAQRRNKFGNAIMLASLLGIGYGAAELAGAVPVGIPSILGGSGAHEHASNAVTGHHGGTGGAENATGGHPGAGTGGAENGAGTGGAAGSGAENGVTAGSPGHEHVEFYNPTLGNHGVGVELPPDLQFHQEIPNGAYSIVDNHGNVLIDHVLWDRQGNLSDATRELLKQKGYELHQDVLTYVGAGGQLQEHFMTEVNQS